MKKDRKQYLRDHHAEHPEETAAYKQRQRQKDSIALFHVRRNKLYGHPIPEAIAQDADRISRMEQEYARRLAEPVEVEISGE